MLLIPFFFSALPIKDSVEFRNFRENVRLIFRKIKAQSSLCPSCHNACDSPHTVKPCGKSKQAPKVAGQWENSCAIANVAVKGKKARKYWIVPYNSD